MTIELYDKYDNTAGSISSDLNWKLSDNPSHEYYFYPVIRPASELDLECSNQKYNYFRITDASTVKEAEIIICSPYKTAAFGHTDDQGNAFLDYGGSGQTGAVTFKIGNNIIGTGTVDAAIGAVTKLNFTTAAPNITFRSDGLALTDPPPEIEKRVTKFRLYYKMSSAFNTPSANIDWDMIYAGIGNVNIKVPLLASPSTAYTEILDSYSGVDLYTPYLVTQMRVTASDWDDVGNTPPYTIVFKCKIYN